MRLIDADKLIESAFDRYCKGCDKRKGVKNGKWRVIYDVGDAPCRACEVDDMKAELEDAPSVDAVPIVRCKDCIQSKHDEIFNHWWCDGRMVNPFHFCGYGERKSDLSLQTDNTED